MIKCFVVSILMLAAFSVSASCHGRHLNPITDLCWKCLFPIHIVGAQVVPSSMPDKKPTTNPGCICKRPPAKIPSAGFPIAFWEPVRVVDVTKDPMCMVSLGGTSFGSKMSKGYKDDQDGNAFWHVHWYVYPAIFILELLTDFICLEKMSYDIAYLSEFDPLWSDDIKTTILNPEAASFGSLPAQAACIADCGQSSFGLANDSLIWCAGCQGSMYPFTGNISGQNGGVGGSSLMVARMIAKLHRQGLLWATWGKKMTSETCSKYLSFTVEKSAYRYQMVYPVVETSDCKRIGQTEVLWQAGKEFPVKGEDFSYFVWRKKECCLTAY